MRRHAILALVLWGLGGCSHGEESECSKYVSLLSGENPRSAFGALSEKKCQDALPLLLEMFDPRQGKYNREIIRVVTDIWDPSEQVYKAEAEKFRKKKPLYTEILRKALLTPETAAVAASAAAEWGIRDLKGDLVRLLEEDIKSTQPQFASAYAPVLRALISDDFGGVSEEQEEIFLVLLDNSPDIQGIEVNKIAAEALGKLKTRNPEAIRALIRGLFVVSKEGGTLFKESLHALLQIGKDAVPYLVDVMESKPGDEKVRHMEEFAVKNAVSEWKWRMGMRIPMVLAQLRDARAAMAFVHDIARPIIEPPNLPDSLREDWTITQTNRLKFDSWGLMSVAVPEVLPEALKVIRDRNVEGSARLQLALGLSFYFTPEATKTLFEVITLSEEEEPEEIEDESPEGIARRKLLAELPPPARESDFIIRYLQPLAYAVTSKELAQFEDIFVEGFDEYFGDQEKADDIREKLDQIDVKVLLDVVRACQEQYGCYLAVFNGGPGVVEGNEENKYDPNTVKGADERETKYLQAMARAKAGLVLSRWEAKKEQRAEILEAFERTFSTLPYDDELYGDLRQVILLGLERQGEKDRKNTASLIRKLIKKEEAKEIDAVRGWNQRLEALALHLEG